MHHKTHPKKPLFTDKKEAELFLNLFNDFDDENHIKVAKAIFIDGMTNEEAAEYIGYSERHMQRLRTDILKVALKRAIRKLSC